MKTDIDFACSDADSSRQSRAFIAGCLAFIIAGGFYILAHSNHAKLREQVRVLATKQSLPGALARDTIAKSSGMELEALGAVVSQLNTPVFHAIEALHPPADIAVALLSLDFRQSGAGPGTTERRLSVMAEARTYKDVTNYMGVLTERKRLHAIELTKHEANIESPQLPIRFYLEAEWK